MESKKKLNPMLHFMESKRFSFGIILRPFVSSLFLIRISHLILILIKEGDTYRASFLFPIYLHLIVYLCYYSQFAFLVYLFEKVGYLLFLSFLNGAKNYGRIVVKFPGTLYPSIFYIHSSIYPSATSITAITSITRVPQTDSLSLFPSLIVFYYSSSYYISL